MALRIVVYGECNSRGGVTQSTKEILRIGRELCKDSGSELIAAMLGSDLRNAAQDAICHGADKVYIVEQSILSNFQPELYLHAIEEINAEIKPDILLVANNPSGVDVATRLAFRLGSSITTDCIGLSIDPQTKLLIQTKPIYGGNVIARYCSKFKPQIATVREKTFPAAERDDSRSGEVVDFTLKKEIVEPRVKYVKRVSEEYQGKRLEEAEMVVCGGRGMGTEADFNQLSELAEILGGVLAGSRPTVEKGWIHSRFQVGLTGVKISPKLYIGIGVSGAIQHMAGMLGSEIIVAINKDPEATIFKEAHIGVVGDFKEVLPAFKEKVKELRVK